MLELFAFAKEVGITLIPSKEISVNETRRIYIIFFDIKFCTKDLFILSPCSWTIHYYKQVITLLLLFARSEDLMVEL